MRKLCSVLKAIVVLVLASPLAIAWAPAAWLPALLPPAFAATLASSFRELAITLAATLAAAMLVTLTLGYASVLSQRFGRSAASVLNSVESVPAILVALFCYAPVSGYLARHAISASQTMSLAVFILAAALTALPEAVRSVAIPLGELYHRRYSLSFRSYGFTKRRILAVLMGSREMLDTLRRVAAAVVLKTLVLDCSLGFIIQLGFGSYGTPAHASPGALIAAHRDALFDGGTPVLFWLPSLLLAAVSLSFLLTLGDRREAAA
jgi:ABC-type dipeptide/oligopeptide/nickel transport system permease subunit